MERKAYKIKYFHYTANVREHKPILNHATRLTFPRESLSHKTEINNCKQPVCFVQYFFFSVRNFFIKERKFTFLGAGTGPIPYGKEIITCTLVSIRDLVRTTRANETANRVLAHGIPVTIVSSQRAFIYICHETFKKERHMIEMV